MNGGRKTRIRKQKGHGSRRAKKNHSPEEVYVPILGMSKAAPCANSVLKIDMSVKSSRQQSTLVTDLEATLNVIVKCVNESGVLVGWCLNAYILIKPSQSISSILYLRKYPDENNIVFTPFTVGKGVPWRDKYATLEAYWEDEVAGRTAFVANIDSSIGQGSGSFLFALQLLLTETIGTVRLDLSNNIDDPPRAAAGIYSQLRFKGKGSTADLGTWAHKSEGEMYWTREAKPSSSEKKQTALDHLYTKIQKARSKATGSGTSIWSTDEASVVALMGCLKTYLPATEKPIKGAYAGGRRRRRKYTRRNRGRKYKTRRRRTRH